MPKAISRVPHPFTRFLREWVGYHEPQPAGNNPSTHPPRLFSGADKPKAAARTAGAGCPHGRCLADEQLTNNPRHSLQRRVDPSLIFPASLGDLRLPTARSANQLCNAANQLSSLNSLG